MKCSIRFGHVAGVLAALALSPARADEGMWTYNRFPVEAVRRAVGVAVTPSWLDHLRLSTLRMSGGCSASVVSPNGLVMTNHHCVRDCVGDLATHAGRDYAQDGFLARRAEEALRCPGMELDRLESIVEVTDRVREATRGVEPGGFEAAQRAAFASLERACATSAEIRCEVVTLYRGGRYDLYTYRRLGDARLVFAPEDAIASFGGDPDNFNFPRHDFDVAFLRLHGADGKPLATPDHLAWSDGRLKEGDATFVAGNPGRTSREFTLAQFDDERLVDLPHRMMRTAERRGWLLEYRQRGPEQKRLAGTPLFGTENTLKVLVGQQAALADPAFFGRLAADEARLRAAVRADPTLQARYGDVWDRIAVLVARRRALRPRYEALEGGRRSQLFDIARGLLRYAAEAPKPDAERLREFSDARLPRWREQLLADRAISPELEIAQLGWVLSKLREDLGSDDPTVRRVFGRRSPAEIATAAVAGSRLGEVPSGPDGAPSGGLRWTLLAGGPAAIDASHDPMLELARALEPDARAIRQAMETEVEGPLRQQQERLAQVRFAIDGDRRSPDATFTPRVSYGRVAGYDEAGRPVPPFTTLGGAYERDTGAEPYALPPSWLRARGRLDPALPFDVVTTNDIIGGNSGSPVVDRDGAVVGVAFDGNIHSLGGDYGFDPASNRTIALHSAAVLEVLDRVYGAGQLADELRSTQRPAGSLR